MRILVYRGQVGPDLPVVGTTVFWLLLDRLQVRGWVLGAIWTLVALYWIGIILIMIQRPYGNLKSSCFENVRE